MKIQLLCSGVLLLAGIALVGCEARVADGDGTVTPVDDRPVVVNRPVVVDPDPAPRRDVDADINITGPRGGGVRVDVDGDNGVRGDADVDVDVDRPILRDRVRDRDNDVRVRETPRGVKVDVRD